MAVTHHALVTCLGLKIGISPKEVSDFRLDSLRQQGSRPVAQNLSERISESPWLSQLDDVSVGHGVSLLRWRSGGVEHPHDTPPYLFMPSPTFDHSSDEALAQEIINLLFCKILDEQDTAPDDPVQFRAGVGEPAKEIQKRINRLFEAVKRTAYRDVFDPLDSIKLDSESLCYVVGELQNYSVTEADRDAIGDAFEVFIGPALRGSEGQFFTPRNVVEMMVKIVAPKPGEKIIDPACGSGGFLISALTYVWAALRSEAKRKGWSERQLVKQEFEIATDCFRGIDKDAFLAKVAKAYMALVGDGRGGIFCANALAPPSTWSQPMQEKILRGDFDVVLTNPPFGKKIVVKGQNVLSQFDLGYKWQRDKATKTSSKSTTLHEDQPPQILFLERCLQLLKPGGRLGIVLPEAILGMPTYEYVVTWLRERATIRGVISMPEALFKTSGKGGTHAKVCVLFVENCKPRKEEAYDIFMADVKWCGHDSRGNPTIRKDKSGKEILLDEVPIVYETWKHLIGNW
jgi:type I restriction enzyme M protein